MDVGAAHVAVAFVARQLRSDKIVVAYLSLVHDIWDSMIPHTPVVPQPCAHRSSKVNIIVRCSGPEMPAPPSVDLRGGRWTLGHH